MQHVYFFSTFRKCNFQEIWIEKICLKAAVSLISAKTADSRSDVCCFFLRCSADSSEVANDGVSWPASRSSRVSSRQSDEKLRQFFFANLAFYLPLSFAPAEYSLPRNKKFPPSSAGPTWHCICKINILVTSLKGTQSYLSPVLADASIKPSLSLPRCMRKYFAGRIARLLGVEVPGSESKCAKNGLRIFCIGNRIVSSQCWFKFIWNYGEPRRVIFFFRSSCFSACDFIKKKYFLKKSKYSKNDFLRLHIYSRIQCVIQGSVFSYFQHLSRSLCVLTKNNWE